MSERAFIPRNYPKSFVILIIALLSGLLSGGIAFLGAWLENTMVETIGRFCFFACWAAAAAMFAVFLPGILTDKYRDLHRARGKNRFGS